MSQRVIAMWKSDAHTAMLFGDGYYVGREVPPKELKFFGSVITWPVPKIELDGGKVVWGPECMFGPPEKVHRMVGRRKVVYVDVDLVREGHYDKQRGEEALTDAERATGQLGADVSGEEGKTEEAGKVSGDNKNE